MEPPTYAWIIPGRLAVSERPGGAGRSHRRARRQEELDWWISQGVRAVVSGMRTRHGLVEYVERGLEVRWHPLRDPDQARGEVTDLGEWLAAADARLRMTLGLARTARTALRAAAADGLPVGSLATSIVGPPMSAAA